MLDEILVAVDGSEHSAKAVDLAADLAVKYGSGLAVLHVMPRTNGYGIPAGLERYVEIENVFITGHEVLETIAERIVTEARDRAVRRGVTDPEAIVEVGHPASKIVEMAEKLGAEMIVIGSRGLSDLGGLMLGSVSHRVAHTAPCTVVTVK